MSKQVPNELSQDGPDKLDKVFVVGAVKISIHLHSDWPVTVNELSQGGNILLTCSSQSQ